MPSSEGSGSGENPSLFASLRSFWGVLLAILYTRLDLVTAELEEGAVQVLKLLVIALIGILCLFVAFFFAMYLLIAAYWDTEYRLYVIGGVLCVYLLGGLAAILAARNMILNRPKFLSQTIAELRRDAEGLSRAISNKTDGGAS